MKQDLTAPLRPLADAWLDAVRTPRQRAVTAFVVLVVLVALLVAREGTARARLGAALALGITAVVLGLLARRERRVWSEPARVLRRVGQSADPERTDRALRALTLLDDGGNARSKENKTLRRDGTSRELARLHVARSIAALPYDRIVDAARRYGSRLKIAAIVLAVPALVLCLTNPWALFEGADVLVARHRVGPLAMRWLDDLEVRARPPEYLHEDEWREIPFAELSLPRGTLITFRGVATHTGRRLTLTDGASEVPFVDDGAGGMIARWPLAESVNLRVVANFGNVVIEEPQLTPVISIQDRAPDVTLEGAPKQLVLASGEEVTEIPIRYEVTDDHGLREVHLVLRSGTREERRVLARLDGETRFDRGGHVLRATDPFLKKSHAPVEVRVEAKDNDPVTGPKWGASAAITVVPPDVGEPEARRIDGLRKLRDALVDTLGWRLSHSVPSTAAGRKAFLSDELRGADENAELLDATLTGSYAGVRVAPRLQAMLRGQMRKVREAVDMEARAPSVGTHALLIKTTERLVLVIDAMLRGLGFHDAKESARQLAEVADELAAGASQLQRDPKLEAARGIARMDAASLVLNGGSRAMMHLGSLGRDLGEIIGSDLSRVSRARKENDLWHAELAARDLAARLHQPDPSFGSQGKSGRGGGESGGARGTPGDGAEGEGDADQAFNEAAQELEQLANDHAAGVGNVERALSGKSSDEELKSLIEEAKKHAAAVREAARPLPSVGAGSDSWTSKGAAAREHADQMAHSLEQGNPADAVTSGRNALQALDEAKRTAQRERFSSFAPSGDTDAEKRIDDARKKLEPEVKWAEEQLEGLRKKASERAGSDLATSGDEENKMADRAKKLGEKGREQALPAPAIDSLEAAERAARDAARALKRGEADKALNKQHEAQRLLEMAKEALGASNDGDRGSEGEGDPSSDHAEIPKADAHKGPEDFRRRVINGLGQPSSGRHKDAVRRYAEGLLR